MYSVIPVLLKICILLLLSVVLSMSLQISKSLRAKAVTKPYLFSFQVTVLSACGEECVIATKVNTAVDK